MNKSIVVGNVGQDPTLRYLDDGTPVTTLSVCANDRIGSGENRTDNAVWYRAEFFGNSAEIITKLNTEINAALADPTVKARITDAGGMLLPGSPAEFGKLIADETEKWAKVVKFSGAKAD